MPESKRPLKVFLCHASTDKPKVRELYRYLKRRGINPWFDEEHLVGGQDWQVEIPKALATSDAIIICLTKNSVDKEGYIQKEIKFALDKALEMPEGRIFLIPVKFEECEVPFSLSRYQWVDLTVESGYAKMMKALKFRASQLERSTVEVTKKDVEEENLAREKAVKEAAEKARLKVEEEQRRIANEKTERESAERAERERTAKEEREKQARQKTAKKIQREYENTVKKAKRNLWWEKLKIDIRYRFKLIYIYRVPILILVITFAFVTPLLIRLSNLIPEIITTFNSTPITTTGLTPTPQASPNSTEILALDSTSLPTEMMNGKSVSMTIVKAGEWVFSEDWCTTDNQYRYSLVYKVSIRDDGTFTRGAAAQVFQDGSSVSAPAFDYTNSYGSWFSDGNQITLFVGDYKYTGEVEVDKISNGKIFSNAGSNVKCWSAKYSGR